MDVVTFASLLSGYLFFGSSIFWSVMGLAVHNKLDSSVGLAIGLTFFLQFLGMAILVVKYLTLKAKEQSEVAATNWNSSDWVETDSPSSIWSANSDDWQTEPAIEKDVSTWVTFGLLMGSTLSFLISFFLPWFYQSIDFIDPEVYVLSTGLEVWIFISLIAFVTAAVLLLFQRTYLWAVILVAHFSSWWLALSLASLINRIDFAKAMEAMFNLPNLVTGLDSGFGVEFVNQSAGEAWFIVFPAAAMAVAASFLLARNYSIST